MKLINLPISLCVVLLLGCEANVMESPRIIWATGWDFSKYSEKGFLITPEAYNGKYVSIGLITLTVIPEVKKKEPGSRFDENKYYEVFKDNYEPYLIEKPDPEAVLNEMVNMAAKMGADAMTHFSSNSRRETVSRTEGWQKVIIEVSGYAIKRKE